MKNIFIFLSLLCSNTFCISTNDIQVYHFVLWKLAKCLSECEGCYATSKAKISQNIVDCEIFFQRIRHDMNVNFRLVANVKVLFLSFCFVSWMKENKKVLIAYDTFILPNHYFVKRNLETNLLVFINLILVANHSCYITTCVSCI